jgi:hypothetical protein
MFIQSSRVKGVRYYRPPVALCRVMNFPSLIPSAFVNRRMQVALERAQECERAAAAITDPAFRAQWLQLARQWRELAASAQELDDKDSKDN